MSSTKCPHCGLVNFSSAVTCKRCNRVLASSGDSTVSYQEGDVALSTSSEQAPPRTLGILLTILGVVLSLAGIYLLAIGGSTLYFLVAGIGISASGVLITAGKRTGMYLYFVTFGVMFIWSLLETGGNAGKMMSRLFVAALIGLYLVTDKVRARLN
jgi:phage FluMu protein Com